MVKNKSGHDHPVISEARAFKKHFVGELVNLSTSGFGLVAALAWNELIKEVVEEYIKPIAGESSGILSLLIYAVIITILAVTVTYYLSKLQKED